MPNNIYDDTVSEKAIWEGSITPDNDTPSFASQMQSQPQMMFCYKCNQVIPADSKFCPYCQIELYVICPKCGVKYSSQYPICNQCGTNRQEYLKWQREEEIKRKNEEFIRKKFEESERLRKEKEKSEEMKKIEENNRIYNIYLAIDTKAKSIGFWTHFILAPLSIVTFFVSGFVDFFVENQWHCFLFEHIGYWSILIGLLEFTILCYLLNYLTIVLPPIVAYKILIKKYENENTDDINTIKFIKNNNINARTLLKTSTWIEYHKRKFNN